MDCRDGDTPFAAQRGGPTPFPTTHWETIFKARSKGSIENCPALESLCRRYWYPLYCFARKQGNSHHTAEDLTQTYLARLLSTGGLDRVRPELGRFRTFLLTGLRHFITNEWHRAQTEKRGGGTKVLSLDYERADTRYSVEPVDSTLTPEQAFDRSWALALVKQALAELETEYGATGRAALFDAIAPIVWGGGARETLVEQADRLGLSGTALKVAIHRLRRRLRARLEDQVRATVSSEAEVAAELTHLLSAVAQQSHSM